MAIPRFIRYLILSLIIPSVSIWAQTLHYEQQTIDQVHVHVHTPTGVTYNHSSVISRIKTKPGGTFSQADFDEDLKTLTQDYDRIEPSVEGEDGQLNITLDLWPKATIHRIHWVGNHHIPTKTLQKELNIECKTVFDRLAFNEAFHKIKAYYVKKGFFEAQMDYAICLNEETNQVDITVTIEEGRSGKIQDIIFVDFCPDEENHVLKEMVTKKYNIFTSWFTETGVYHREAVQQDEMVITNYLQNQGYADAQVRIEIEESPKSDRILVRVIADKGERYYFGRISFEGNTQICDEKIDQYFTVRPGEPFSLEDIRETLEIIGDAYGKIGYVDALVDFDPILVDGTNTYDVSFTIEEGSPYKVGLIRVFGNLITKTPVILNETLMVPGETFNTLKLKATEQRLLNIGFFKHVNVYIVKGTESSLGPEYRDVYIEVEEGNTGEFSASLGYSSSEEIFGAINITERNFNHIGLYYLFRDGLQALRGGGEYAYLALQIGQKSKSATISWTKPYFMDSKWTVGFDLTNSITRYISRDYGINSVSLVLRAQRNLNQYVRFGVQYRLTNGAVKLHDHGDHIKGLEEAAHLNSLISAIGTSLTYDNTNHPVKPTRGFRSKLFAEFAGVGGDHTFLSVGYFNSYYVPLGSRMFLKYRADMRFIQPLGSTSFHTIPLDERFFLGGDYNVRGFRPYRLGPHYESDKHIPKGGISMQLFSAEINRRIIEDVEVFGFMDAGFLSAGTWDFGRLSVSIGYGTRFKVIPSIPQITLGMGYPLNARNRNEVKRFFISFGGNF